MLFDVINEALVRLGIKGVVVLGDTNDLNWMLELFSNGANRRLRGTAVFDKMRVAFDLDVFLVRLVPISVRAAFAWTLPKIWSVRAVREGR